MKNRGYFCLFGFWVFSSRLYFITVVQFWTFTEVKTIIYLFHPYVQMTSHKKILVRDYYFYPCMWKPWRKNPEPKLTKISSIFQKLNMTSDMFCNHRFDKKKPRDISIIQLNFHASEIMWDYYNDLSPNSVTATNIFQQTHPILLSLTKIPYAYMSKKKSHKGGR